MTPSPPARAIAIAMRASVTVSMLAATIGAVIVSLRVSRAEVSTSDREPMPDLRGTSRTSSYVRASGKSGTAPAPYFSA